MTSQSCFLPPKILDSVFHVEPTNKGIKSEKTKAWKDEKTKRLKYKKVVGRDMD